MIRYIHVGNQHMLDDEEPYDEFAFYDTVRCEFMEIGVSQMWSTVDDLREDHAIDDDPPSLTRLIGLIPGGRHGKPKDESDDG